MNVCKVIIALISIVATLTLHAEGNDNRFALRLLNHWDNPDGTVERGFAGRSIWKWDQIPAGKGAIPEALRTRYEEYGRMNQAIGINGTVLNNVNAKPMMLHSDMLRKTAKIADILRPYGIKVYLSVNFASPKALGDCKTADPLDKDIQIWWTKKAKEIYKLIPDFGGFLVKANSEGEPGPMDYGRTHVDGANMLAKALIDGSAEARGKASKLSSLNSQPIVMWRAFVYSAKGGDRASQAYHEFLPYDGQFADNVIIQIKNGPIDFQPREPLSPLFFALKKTKMMLELQITQEYTGNSIQTCYLATEWQKIIGPPSPKGGVHPVGLRQLPNLVGVAGVANIGDTANWCGNDLARANWYAFGRLTSDPSCTARQAVEEWLKKEYTDDDQFVKPMAQLMMKSHEAVVSYMMPLGLHHIFAGGHHYGPEPWYAPEGCREDWLPRYYHKADSVGIGFERCGPPAPLIDDQPLSKKERDVHPAGIQISGNQSASTPPWGDGGLIYPEPLRTIYANVETCPEDLLLWFHHVSWDYTMRNGLTLWENLCYKYDEGVRTAESFVETWKAMKPYVDATRYNAQLVRFERQAKDAWWWRDACLLYFQTFSRRDLPVDSPQPRHRLSDLMNFHLNIDNYTAAPIDSLP